MNLNKKYNQIVSSVKMTHDEKNAMRSSLVWHVRSNHKPVKSHFYNIPWVRYGMAFAFLMLVSGSGVSFASQNALPGDLSYSWKIQIEEIKGITKTTPKKKLIYSKERAQIRLTEMKTLLANTATTSEKTAENIAIASKELESHIKDAKDNAIIIAEVAQELNQPVIIGASEGEREYMGVEMVRTIVTELNEEYDVPIILNADHTY